MPDVPDLAELSAALERDPHGVAEQARALATTYRDAGDARSLSRSLAILGRAYRLLGDIDLAERALREAVDAGDAAGDPETIADAHLGLASVLSFSGRADDAFDHLRVVEERGSPRQRAHASLQRAAVAQRLGQVETALALYEAALPMLRAEGATVDIARVLQNRGVVRAGAGQAAEAVADFAEAAALFTAAGQEFGATQATHNLGWAAARLGDIPRALRAYDEAEAAFVRLGHPAAEAQVDRAEVLLAAGLSQDAGTLAARAAGALTAAGNRSVAALAWLLCAQAARLEGDFAGAVEHAEQSRALFGALQATGWERAARLEALRTTAASAELTTDDLAELESLAGELAAVGDATGEVTALALAAVGVAATDSDRATALAVRCATRAADVGVVETRLLAAHARAAAAVGRSDRPGALRAVRSGLDELARHQATLGATDARAHVSAHGASLAALGLGLALDGGRPAAALQWMERARAGSLRHPPAEPPQDERLAADLAELRAVASDVRRAELDGDDPAELRARQAFLEQAVRRRYLRTSGNERSPANQRTTALQVGALREALRGRVLVSVAQAGGRLHAVVVDGHRARLVHLGPAARAIDAATAAGRALRGLAAPAGSAGAREARQRVLDESLRELDHAILAPLRIRGTGPVVLVVPGPLHAAPWRAAPSLAGRPVSVAPSATWWLEAATTDSKPPPGDPLVVAGPRLAEAEREAAEVAAWYESPRLLVRERATVDAAMAALPSTPIAHLAAHGRFRHDNPLWSSIELADGPLTVYDLQRLPRTPPVLVLSACESGVSGVRAGDELLGLASAVLRAGTRSLVAAVAPLPDSPATRRSMVELHGLLAKGTPPAEALVSVDEPALACFGA